MSADKPKCARCGKVAETYNFDADTTFWGQIGVKVETTTRRLVRIMGQSFSRNPNHRSALLLSDEEKPLCGDCWGLLVGRFMQGRDVPALPGKEGR